MNINELKKRNKIRDKFKRERLQNVTLAQEKLYTALQPLGKEKHFKIAKEREVYTRQGVRFTDLFIKKYGLNIEVDGNYHLTEDQKSKDISKEKELWDKKRIITIRFTNYEILNDLNNVIKNINLFINKLETLPNWKSSGKGIKKLRTTITRKKYYKEWLKQKERLS